MSKWTRTSTSGRTSTTRPSAGTSLRSTFTLCLDIYVIIQQTSTCSCRRAMLVGSPRTSRGGRGVVYVPARAIRASVCECHFGAHSLSPWTLAPPPMAGSRLWHRRRRHLQGLPLSCSTDRETCTAARGSRDDRALAVGRRRWYLQGPPWTPLSCLKAIRTL